MKIMVVDDEKSVQRLFEQRFRKERKSGLVQFQFAFSAQEALNILKQEGTGDLTVILSDINMPHMNGFELLQVIRKEYPSVPVIMITAYGDDEKQRLAAEFGAQAYFTKPLDFHQLKERILP